MVSVSKYFKQKEQHVQMSWDREEHSAFKEVKGSLQTSLVARIRGILWIRDFIPKVMRDLKSC